MDFGGTRESFRSYLKRELFVDPEVEARERELRREAAIAKEAHHAMRGTPSATRRGPTLPGAAGYPATSGDPSDGSVEVHVQRRLARGMYENRAMTGSARQAAKGASRGQIQVAKWQSEHKSGEVSGYRSQSWLSEARTVRSGASSLGSPLQRAGAGVASSPHAGGSMAGQRGGRRSSASHTTGTDARTRRGSTGGLGASAPAAGRSPSTDRPKRRRRKGAAPPAGHRPFRRGGAVHHDPATGSFRPGAEDPGPVPSRPSTLVRVPKEHKPKLVGDDRLGSVPVESLRRMRWEELRWLHALLVRQGKQPSGLAEYLSLEGGIRSTLFVVNMTGFAGVPDRIIGEHASALFKSFDISRTGIVDPREIYCCLRVIDKPHDTPSQLMQWCIQFYAVRRKSDNTTCIPSDDLLFLLFVPCESFEDEQALKRHMPELTQALERFTGDPWPKLISRHSLSLALSESHKFCDEYRRQCMRRLPDDVRLAIMRRAAEEASLVVQGRERALQIQKAALYLRDKMNPRVLRDHFFAWSEHAREQVVMRAIDEMCDAHFRQAGLRRGVRQWRRRARLPRINAIAKARCPKKRLVRMLARWKARMRYFRILKRMEDEKKSEELALRAERAYKWAEGWRLRRRVETMRGIFYAMKVSLRAYQRKKAAAKWLRKKRLMRTFFSWKREVIETIQKRIDLKFRSDYAHKALSERLKAAEEQERAEREAEAARVEAEKKKEEEYQEIMRRQRARAAVVMAYDRSAAALAQKRAFERQRMFQKTLRDSARRWERDFPDLLEEELDKQRTWLRTTIDGKEEFENHVVYTMSSVELAVPTEPLKTLDSEKAEEEKQKQQIRAEQAKQRKAANLSGSGMAMAVGADAAMAAADKLREMYGGDGEEGEEGFAMPINDVEKLDDHGLDPKDRWQLVFRFGDLCRAWVKQDTGEEIGPASNRVGLTRINRKLGERIALENWEGRRARRLAKELDTTKQQRYELALQDAYASVIQRWFRAYLTVRSWKRIREETLKVYRRAQIRIKAVRRKAAVMAVQCFWRCVKARREVLRRLLGRWCLMGDFENDVPFYMNMHTMESLWDEPGLVRALARHSWDKGRTRRVLMMKPSARHKYFEMNGGDLQQLLGFESAEEAEEFEAAELKHEREAVESKRKLIGSTSSGRKAGRSDSGASSRSESGSSSKQGAGDGGPSGADKGPASGAGADEDPGQGQASGGSAQAVPAWYQKCIDAAVPMSSAAQERMASVYGDMDEREQWVSVVETGGAYFQHHLSGEVRQYAPGGYIVCEECKSYFATCYVDGMDKVLCSTCFISMHKKPSRVATYAYIVPRGRYWHPYQAPDHVPRTPYQLFGDEFCQPLVEMARPKPELFKKYFVYDAT